MSGNAPAKGNRFPEHFKSRLNSSSNTPLLVSEQIAWHPSQHDGRAQLKTTWALRDLVGDCQMVPTLRGPHKPTVRNGARHFF